MVLREDSSLSSLTLRAPQGIPCALGEEQVDNCLIMQFSRGQICIVTSELGQSVFCYGRQAWGDCISPVLITGKGLEKERDSHWKGTHTDVPSDVHWAKQLHLNCKPNKGLTHRAAQASPDVTLFIACSSGHQYCWELLNLTQAI